MKHIEGMWVPHAQELSGPFGHDIGSSQCLNKEGSVPANVNATADFSKSLLRPTEQTVTKPFLRGSWA